MPVSTRPLRIACLVVIILSLLAAGYALMQRIRAEQSSRAVDVVLDYQEVLDLATLEGTEPGKVLSALKAAGATGVAVTEETLDSLEEQELVEIHPLPAHDYRETSGFLFQTSQSDAQRFITAGLQLHGVITTPVSNTSDGRTWVALGSPVVLRNAGLGLLPEKVAMVQAAGLRVVPRLQAGVDVTEQGLRASLAQTAALLPVPSRPILLTNPLTVPPGVLLARRMRIEMRGVVIFEGDMLPGYRKLLPNLAETLVENGLVYGAVEFAKQKGDGELGGRLQGQLVRVHSISSLEMATLSEAQAVQRFGLAVKDRNIRVLYVHFPPLSSASPLATAGDYIRGVAGEVRAQGFTVSAAAPAHPFAPLSLPLPVLALLFAGAGAGFLYWLLMVLPTALPAGLFRLGWGLFVFGIMGAGLAAVVPSYGRMLFGLLAAISFPMIALTWAYGRVQQLAQYGARRPFLVAVGILLGATAITLLGALIIAGSMAETRYLVKVGQFTGVKATLVLPLLLFTALIITDGVAQQGETFAAYLARLKARVVNFLAQPIYLWGVGLAVGALVVLALMMTRSGNEGMGVSGAELHLRSTLEQLLVARPRTKEFLFGHPLFLLSMLCAARGKRLWALALLLPAAIGQADVLNTYCHAHTPVMLSLIRTFNGLWLGIALTFVALLLFGRGLLKPVTVESTPVAEGVRE